MAQAPESKEQENIDPIQLFTPAVQNAVEGLSYLGRHTKDVIYGGHTFGLQTLKPEYRYAAGKVVQPYRNTLVEVNAWRNAHIAASLTHVDHREDFCDPIGPDLEQFVQGRLQYISTQWYKPTLDFLWAEYVLLEDEAAKAVEQLNFLYSQNMLTPSRDLLDILMSPEPLMEEIPLDIQPLPISNEF